MVVKLYHLSKIQDSNWIKYYIFAILTPWKTDFIEMLTLSMRVEDLSASEMLENINEAYYYK